MLEPQQAASLHAESPLGRLCGPGRQHGGGLGSLHGRRRVQREWRASHRGLDQRPRRVERARPAAAPTSRGRRGRRGGEPPGERRQRLLVGGHRGRRQHDLLVRHAPLCHERPVPHRAKHKHSVDISCWEHFNWIN